MENISLYKIFYKEPERHEEEYKNRFNAPFTKHLNVSIHEFNRKDSYPAFFYYTDKVLNYLNSILQLNQDLSNEVADIPAMAFNKFFRQSLIEEIKASNDIEGVHSTRKEISEALWGFENKEHVKRFMSIISKYFNILHKEEIPFESSQDIRNFYNSFILEEVIRDDPKNAPDGKLFRTSSVSVYSESGKEIHRGLFPERKIIETMDYALHVLNQEDIPKILRIAVFHYLFGYIHPFYDGNGRTSRFITSYYLSKELNLLIGLRLSVIIKRQKTKYYEMFSITNSELNRGDITPFIEGFLGIIYDTLFDTHEKLSQKRNELSQKRIILQNNIQNWDELDETTQNIYELLLEAELFSEEGTTVEEIQRGLGKARNTIDKRLNNIPEEHYFKTKISKAFKYRLNPNLLIE